MALRCELFSSRYSLLCVPARVHSESENSGGMLFRNAGTKKRWLLCHAFTSNAFWTCPDRNRFQTSFSLLFELYVPIFVMFPKTWRSSIRFYFFAPENIMSQRQMYGEIITFFKCFFVAICSVRTVETYFTNFDLFSYFFIFSGMEKSILCQCFIEIFENENFNEIRLLDCESFSLLINNQ